MAFPGMDLDSGLIVQQQFLLMSVSKRRCQRYNRSLVATQDPVSSANGGSCLVSQRERAGRDAALLVGCLLAARSCSCLSILIIIASSIDDEQALATAFPNVNLSKSGHKESIKHDAARLASAHS